MGSIGRTTINNSKDNDTIKAEQTTQYKYEQIIGNGKTV